MSVNTITVAQGTPEMRLRNSTDFADWFLRRLVSWSCRELGLPVREVAAVQFTNTRHAYRGRAWSSGRILVRIGDGRHFPKKGKYPGRVNAPEYELADRLEALVHVTAHELAHLSQWHECGHRVRVREAAVDGLGLAVLRAFREQRRTLTARWEAEPAGRSRKPKPTLRERNEARARDALKRWERKKKLAETKVKQYRRKVRYYERTAGGR